MIIKRSQEEIDELLNRCAESQDTGGSTYPGMTYEQGIQAGIMWLIGDWDDHPLEDE